MKKFIAGVLMAAFAAFFMSGCSNISPNQVTVGWSEACHVVAIKRTRLENEAKNGDFTALQKAEIKQLNDQAVGLCTTPPSSKDSAAITAQITALGTKLAVFEAINKGVKP